MHYMCLVAIIGNALLLHEQVLQGTLDHAKSALNSL
jgi:hypothetical protein